MAWTSSFTALHTMAQLTLLPGEGQEEEQVYVDDQSLATFMESLRQSCGSNLQVVMETSPPPQLPLPPGSEDGQLGLPSGEAWRDSRPPQGLPAGHGQSQHSQHQQLQLCLLRQRGDRGHQGPQSSAWRPLPPLRNQAPALPGASQHHAL